MKDLEDALAGMAVMGMGLKAMGLDTPEKMAEFEAKGDAMAETLVSVAVAMAVKGNMDFEDGEAIAATADQVAVASYALDTAAKQMTEALQKALAGQIMTDMIGEILEAAMNDEGDEG